MNLAPQELNRVIERLEHFLTKAIVMESKIHKEDLDCEDVTSIWIHLTANMLDQCFDDPDCKHLLDSFMLQVQMIRKGQKMMEAGDKEGIEKLAMETAELMGCKNVTIIHVDEEK